MRLVRIDFYKLKLSFGIISAQQRMAKIKNAMVLSPIQPLRISHVTTKYDKHWECNGPIANRTFAHFKTWLLKITQIIKQTNSCNFLVLTLNKSTFAQFKHHICSNRIKQ